MAGAYGKSEDLHFDENEEQFDAYVERLEQFFVANGLKLGEEKTKAVFLTVVGKKNHMLLMDLCAPDRPSEKSLKELLLLLREHFVPKTNVIAERYKFNTRNQREDESISEYMASLRKLAASCHFGTFLDDALRDRFVCGVKAAELRDRMLTAAHSKDLTLSAAYDMGLAHEVTKRNAQQWSHKAFKANAISKAAVFKKEERGKPCYRCTGKGHAPDECRFKEVDCRVCKKKGHIAKACRSRPEGRREKPTKWTKHLDATARADDSDRVNVQETPTRAPSLPDETPSDVASRERETTTSPVKPEQQKDGTAESAPEPGFATQYRAGNVRDVELFSIDTESGDTASEAGSEIVKPYYVYIRVNEKRLKMEIDTGAAVSVISEKLYKRRFKKEKLMHSNCVLRTYSKQSLRLMGSISVKVKCNGSTRILPLLVVKGNGPALLGRDWIQQLKLNWSFVNKVAPDSLEELCDRYPEVFQPSLGKVTGIKAKLHVVSGAVPKFCKPRPVPYALRDAVEAQLNKMEADGVITPVYFSEWAAPTVNIPKVDQTVRICGDYKVSINPWLEVDQYPIPKPQDLFTKLAGGKKFTKLDLSQAYQQVELDESSKQYLTINTHKGLYQVNRLPYGVASAPAIFQKLMDQVLQGIDGVICYLDDILITGQDTETHMKHLEEVLKRLKSHNLRVNKEKCVFFQHSVSYLGHVVDAEGIHPMQEKCEAIAKAAVPTTVTELRSFLSLLSYYGKFIPNLSTLIAPMTGLLQKDVKWEWSPSCQKSFEEAKKQLLSNRVLVHYDPQLPLILACDASPVGVGAVISHKMPDGNEKPVAFASRMLTKAEKNYSQIEKEALGLVFGVVKYHEYLFGRKFTLITDHKPLLKILGPKTGVPPLAAARMQRWALILAAYTYEIQYKPSEQHGNADALSRLPMADNSFPRSNPVYRVSYLDSLPLTAKDIAQETQKDPVLAKVKQHVMSGWPKHVPDEALQPYVRRRYELTMENDCVHWGFRVVIPEKLQNRLLSELHDSHWGMVKMKSLSRSLFWWPTLEEDIENVVNSCDICKQQRSMPATAPVHTWKWASGPWERIHLDFAEVNKQMFLVVMDAYARWPEIFHMQTTTSSKTIETLRGLFAAYGLPKEVVTDNGPQFISGEFETFLTMNAVKHIKTPAYHPASNGLAERLVQNFKRSLAKNRAMGGMTLQHCIANFLFSYRNMPHTTTKKTPAELFLKRQVRTRLSLVKPDLSQSISAGGPSTQSDRKRKLRSFSVGQAVLVKNYRGGEKWLNGVITQVLGPVTYMVSVNGACVKRHVNQMLDAKTKPGEQTVINTDGYVDYPFDPGDDLRDTETVTEVCETPEETLEEHQSSGRMDDALGESSSSGCMERPKRNVRPPERLDL